MYEGMTKRVEMKDGNGRVIMAAESKEPKPVSYLISAILNNLGLLITSNAADEMKAEEEGNDE